MEPLTCITSTAAILPDSDIDTDIIFPARFLLITAKKGLGRYAFYEKHYDNGVERPDFFLNQPSARAAEILVAGANFGCGSSREQAVWALHDLGFRVILAPSFGEIFYSNCCKNGILPVALAAADYARAAAAAADGEPLTVDLQTREVVVSDASPLGFEIEDWRREALLKGWDEVLMLLKKEADALIAFEQRHRAAAPWLFAAD